MWLLLAFIAIPMIEIALFINVGGAIGLWPTLAIVLLTAFLGTYLVRTQGLMAMGNVQRSFSDLNDPTEPLAHGAMILIAGVLLVTPGFFTDAVGFGLLAPPIRSKVFHFFKKRVRVQGFKMGSTYTTPTGHGGYTGQNSDVIEGEFSEVDDDKSQTHSPSGWTKH